MAESKNKKSWYKRWWAITLFIFLGLIILGAIFGGNSSNTETQTTSSGGTKIQQPSQPEVRTYQMGEIIEAGDFSWKITKVTTAQQIGEDIFGSFFGEKADGIFVIIDVEVENTGKQAKYLSDSYVKLIDEQSREFSSNSVAAIYLKPEGSALIFEQINPGITKKGKIVYDVPEGISVANVKISSNILSSKVYNVELQIS